MRSSNASGIAPGRVADVPVPIIALVISMYVIYQGVMGLKPATRVLTDAAPVDVQLHDVASQMDTMCRSHARNRINGDTELRSKPVP